MNPYTEKLVLAFYFLSEGKYKSRFFITTPARHQTLRRDIQN